MHVCAVGACTIVPRVLSVVLDAAEKDSLDYSGIGRAPACRVRRETNLEYER